MRVLPFLLGGLLLSAATVPALADIVPRGSDPAGSVIARKVGEEVRFIDVSSWRTVEVDQNLLAGDVLRTNALGQLAILFSDRTQVRLGRNTTLRVKDVGAAGDSALSLESGTIWARAERGGQGLTVDAPAASAAIRGTDWTMSVDASGRTSIIVLEGLVEFSNPFGSLRLAQGEAAVASIGAAPSRVVIVDPDDRQQMLFYLSVRNSFASLPASSLPTAQMRSERARISALPEAGRSAEDWITLAETALSYDGLAEASQAAARARAMPLTRQQQARLDLLDAMAAGADRRYADAARLFERSSGALDPHRRAIAAYGGYFARSLSNPGSNEKPPVTRDGGAYAAMAEAWTTGFVKDIPAAIEVLAQAERRFPDEPTLPAMRAQFALLVDDREQARAAIERALALAPDDPTALEARANLRSGIEGDLAGALDDLQRAAAVAPGSSTVWNGIGLVQSERGADREAEAALRRAIELEPNDPTAHANLALLLLDQDRVREAKAEIDRALELDPAFDAALVARGRYHLQSGEMDAAMNDLLAATTANPAHAQALLLLSAGYYESGQREPAEQALENADRLDPNDPATAMAATAIAIDDYDADRAITSAQEALRRSRARGGDFAALGASRDAGSLLNSAFRLQGLDAWGRFYGDAVFDPFSGSSLLDQSVSGSADPFANSLEFGKNPVDPATSDSGFSSLFQGLMASPEMLAGRSRAANLMRRPFIEGSLGAGYAGDFKDGGWSGQAEVQAFTALPFPVSIYGRIEGMRNDEFRERTHPGSAVPYAGFNLGSETIGGTAYLTARPTPVDRVVAYLDVQRPKESFTDGVLLLGDLSLGFDGIAYDREIDARGLTGGLGWSHTFGYRNVVNAAFFASDISQASDETGIVLVTGFPGGRLPVGARQLSASVDQTSYLGALNHTLGIGDLTLRYGVEGGALDYRRSESSTTVIIGGAPEVTSETNVADVRVARAYADALYAVTPELQVEGGLFGTFMDGSLDIARAEPRLGVGWTPLEGHWLRAGYLRETAGIGSTTLAPIGIVGLQSNRTPLDIGGYADTFAARWDAQWSQAFFTSVDYQHQDLHGLSIAIPASATAIDASDGFERGVIDRVSATANLHIGGGFGLFGTVAHTRSENRTPGPAYGLDLPFVPELAGRAGISFVHPSNLKVTLSATYVGERTGDAGGTVLDDYWTADASLTWEPFDKRFALELGAWNIFDTKFDVATATPGWGPTFTGLLKVRF